MNTVMHLKAYQFIDMQYYLQQIKTYVHLHPLKKRPT